jgi:ABC-type lipoprotein release transport system permease subunit
MIRNYLLITFRGMLKNKAFIAINVFGMGAAIATALVAYLAYHYDATFDAVHKNGSELYRVSSVREFENTRTRFGHVPMPLSEAVNKTIADVDLSSRYQDTWINFKRTNDLFPVNLSYVDPAFFNMFSFDFISGNPAALQDRTSVFISETLAIRLFNSAQEAYGKTITQVDNELREVKIAGVFRDQPANSSFYKRDGAAFMNFETLKGHDPLFREDDWKRTSTLFVKIASPERVAQVQRQLQPFVAHNNATRQDFQVREFVLDNFSTMAHRDRDESVQASTWTAPPSSAIVGSLIMSMLILLIACFNLTNTAIALSARRLKEIGIRKVMGSMRVQLILQFIGETASVCLLALMVGLGMSDFLVAGWNIITSNNIHLSSGNIASTRLLLFMAAVLVFTSILAGSYPAFYISKFQPISILKGKLKFGGTNYFTRILLGLQFAISLIAIVSAVGFYQNARYQRDYDLGFNIRGSVVAWVSDQNEFEAYRNALQDNASIQSIAGARTGIFSDRLHDAVRHESKQIEVDIIEVGDQYIRTMDLRLVDGRDFRKDSETDRKESVIITQNMAALFGWDKPVGKEIIWKDSVKLYVIGVIKDVYTKGLWQEMEPMMIRYVLPDQYRQIVVNTQRENATAVNAYMKAQWASVFPNRLYNGRVLDENLQIVTDLNMSIMYGYGFLGIITLLLSATGLFALVSLNIVNRMKEIGVRKVMGASVFSITRVVNFQFFMILMIGAALGSWASYNWTTVIMGSIWKYYQGVNAITFITAIGLLFTVSLLTIGFKVFSVATMNPVKSLQDE